MKKPRLFFKPVFFAIALFISLGTLPSPAFAVEKTIQYDDAAHEGYFQDLPAGAVETTLFYIERPSVLLKIGLVFAKAGEAQIHAWADGGGNNPDFERDLITPIVVEIAEEEVGTLRWFELTGAQQVTLPALKYLHVGIVRQEAGASLGVDTSTADISRSFLYLPDEPGVKYLVSDGNFITRVTIDESDEAIDFTFENIAEAAGLTDATHPAWGDYDNDGDDDLLLSAGRLFRNNGDESFTDVSEAAGVMDISGHGVWGDYDNDGHLDYYAFSSGKEEGDRDRLVHNNGDTTFTPVDRTERAPFDFFPTQAAAWGDYDNDGWIDLYVANYETRENDVSTCYKDFLWKNLGGGLFKNVTDEAGMEQPYIQCGRGVNWADYDNDGDLDIYVSNYRLNPNFLWENQGDGTFLNKGWHKRVEGQQISGAWGHSIGSVWGDVDNDGDFDLFVGNLAHPRFIDFSDKSMLYINQGAPDFTFADIREEAGITYCETHSDPLFLDYDNDGHLDLFITSVYEDFLGFLYKNNGDLTFTDTTFESGIRVFNGWGVSSADFDDDGDLDIMMRGLYRNDTASTPDNERHFLKVKLVGKKTNRFGIGCRIIVEAGELRMMREIEGGKGTGAQSSLTAHFGLGNAAAAEVVKVLWTSGEETVLNDVAADQTLVLEEEAVPECLNQLGECLDETTLRVCRNWQWVEEECPEGTTCIERFCVADEPLIDGDIDETEMELDEIDVEAEALEAEEEEMAMEREETSEEELADNSENEMSETIEAGQEEEDEESPITEPETSKGGGDGCSHGGKPQVMPLILLFLLLIRGYRSSSAWRLRR